MTPWIIVTLVVAFVVFDVLVLIPVIFRLVAHFTWKPLMEQFPARAPAAEALERRRQSLRIGSSKLGGCVSIAIDEDHLHLIPMKLLHYVGMGPLSIPWDAIELEDLGSRWARAHIAGKTMYAPAWCMELAAVSNHPDDATAAI